MSTGRPTRSLIVVFLPYKIGSKYETDTAIDGSTRCPAAQQDIKKLMELGLQKKPDVEIHLDRYTGEVNQPDK